MEKATLEEELRKIVTKDNVFEITGKKARRQLEENLKQEEGSLDSQKEVINSLVQKIAQDFEGSGSDDESESEPDESDESEESEPEPKKKATAKKGHKKAQEGLMTKKDFKDGAKVLKCNIGDHEFAMDPREFSTGSSGWFYGSKVKLPVGEDKLVMCQLSINCTVLGSKEWKEGKSESKGDKKRKAPSS